MTGLGKLELDTYFSMTLLLTHAVEILPGLPLGPKATTSPLKSF